MYLFLAAIILIPSMFLSLTFIRKDGLGYTLFSFCLIFFLTFFLIPMSTVFDKNFSQWSSQKYSIIDVNGEKHIQFGEYDVNLNKSLFKNIEYEEVYVRFSISRVLLFINKGPVIFDVADEIPKDSKIK